MSHDRVHIPYGSAGFMLIVLVVLTVLAMW